MGKSSGNGLLIFIRLTFIIILLFKQYLYAALNKNTEIIVKKLSRSLSSDTSVGSFHFLLRGNLLYILTSVASPETHR